MPWDKDGNWKTLYYHRWQKPIGLCIYCNEWCEHCNQCRCEVRLLPIGERRWCPNKDMKKETPK